MSVRGVGVYRGLVAAVLQKIQRDAEGTLLAVGDSAAKPLAVSLGFAGNHQIMHRLGEQIAALLPVYSHVLYELEGVGEAAVMLRSVGSHLQRRIHCDVERQLAADGRVDPRIVAAPFLQVGFEDARSVVHRAAVETGEGQDCGVARSDAAECLVFGAHRRFVADEVRPGAAETGRTDSLMGVYHYMVAGSLCNAVQVMVHHPLVIVVHALRQDVTHIA